jgi:DUF917 family protein
MGLESVRRGSDMESARLQSRQDCEDFVRGLCFMGAGGGGRPELGLELLLDQLEAGREIEWVDIDSLDGEAWTASVAGMGGRGGPTGAKEELDSLGCTAEKHDALGRMVSALQALEDSAGVSVGAVVPIEIGASNVPGPAAAALELGVPLVDGDYAGGRAIPEVPQVIPEIKGVTPCPMSFVTRWGDVIILQESVSAAMADRIGRQIIVAVLGGVGVACYLLQVRQAKDLMSHGTLTRALRVGQSIRKAREEGSNPVQAAIDETNGSLLFVGKVTRSEIADVESLAFGLGSHELTGLSDFAGRTFTIWYKNEYHATWLDGKPFVTSPDALIMVHLTDGEPATSYDFSVGDEVAVVGRKAHEAYRTERGLHLLGPRHFGFDFDYVPLEDRLKEFGF